MPVEPSGGLWTEIEGSSNLAAFRYDEKARKLDVRFSGGGVYRYHDVPRETVDQFERADSKGGYLARRIKAIFDAEKLDAV